MAKELDEDPEMLALNLLPLLNYADIKRQWEAAGGDHKKLEHLKGHHMLRKVEANAFALRKERAARAKAARDAALAKG